MTVGVAAMCEHENESPTVIVGADRLVTTRQQSAIEHESPTTKIKQVGSKVPTVSAVSVFSGDVSWAEKLHEMIEETATYILEEKGVEINMSRLADIATDQYQQFTRERIENNLLSHFGISLDEIQNQHRFKDSFVDDVMTEIDRAQEQVQQGLHMLIGGVGPDGPRIFEINGGDQIPKNDMGYSTIGSGKQPASAEFLETEYDTVCDFKQALATVTTATLRARRASGVGGNIDIYAVGENYIERADENTIQALEDRYNRIAEDQRRLKNEIHEREDVGWDPQS